MDTRTALIASASVAGALLAFATLRRSGTAAVEEAEGEAPQATPGVFDFDTYSPFGAMTDIILTPNTDLAAANVSAFLATIRKAEGTAGPNGYRTLFGGSLFSDFSDHPRQAKQFTDKTGQRLWTSAAGAYQFMAVSPIPGTANSTKVNTWDRIAARLGLADFSPASQDAAAIELIREAGALGDVEAGRFDDAVNKVRRIWASLPGAGYNQPERDMDTLRWAYLGAGGTLA